MAYIVIMGAGIGGMPAAYAGCRGRPAVRGHTRDISPTKNTDLSRQATGPKLNNQTVITKTPIARSDESRLSTAQAKCPLPSARDVQARDILKTVVEYALLTIVGSILVTAILLTIEHSVVNLIKRVGELLATRL